MPTLTEISIGALSRRTGVAVSALRYYETLGLISSNRNRGRQRRFLRSDIGVFPLSKQHKLLDLLYPA